METQERWKTIPEFPEYVISNKGRVANKNGFLKSFKLSGGVTLSRDGWKTRLSVKKLMKKVWGIDMERHGCDLARENKPPQVDFAKALATVRNYGL